MSVLTTFATFTITDTGDLTGRNLIQRSFFTKDPWTGPVANVVGNGFGVYHDVECLPVSVKTLRDNIVVSGVTSAVNSDPLFPDILFEEGQQYTLSGRWAQFRNDDKYNKLKFFFVYSDGTSSSIVQPEINNEWRDFVFTTATGKTLNKITSSYSNNGITYVADFKLELGAAKTDWTPAPEDVNTAYIDAQNANNTADYAKNEIDNLEIGGRNIMRNTETMTGNFILPYNGSIINVETDQTVSEWRTNDAVRFYGTGGTSTLIGRMGLANSSSEITQNPKTFIPNQLYTFSAYIKNLSETNSIRFRFMGSAYSDATIVNPGEETRVVITDSRGTTTNTVTIYCNTSATGDTFDFIMWHPKLEYGKKVTDWTPAPEDVNAAIDATNAKIQTKNAVYYQATAPAGIDHKVGDTWFDTSNDYKIHKWNGTTWEAAVLGDQAVGNLDASHISTGTLTAIDIEAGKSQDAAGTIKVYDEQDAIKVSLDKNGLVASYGNVGGWEISNNSIQVNETLEDFDGNIISNYMAIFSSDPNQSDVPHIIASDSTYISDFMPGEIQFSDNNEVTDNNGMNYSKIKSSSIIQIQDVVENGIEYENETSLYPSGLYLSNQRATGASLQSYALLTNNDLLFGADTDVLQRRSIVNWTVLSAERTVKDDLKVTIYHCGHLFWAHFSGMISAGWTSSNTNNTYIPIIVDDTALANSVLISPPQNITKYVIPTDLTNMRLSLTVRTDGQIGISRVAEPIKGNATVTIASYMETCDIFWAHIYSV